MVCHLISINCIATSMIPLKNLESAAATADESEKAE